MDLDIQRIQQQHQRMLAIVERAQTTIKNAQKMGFPYQGLNDTQRTFIAILAAQGRDVACAACKQLGLELKSDIAFDPAVVEEFFRESAALVGTSASCMEGARINAIDALLETATGLVARAERVLEQDETMRGEPIVHGELWYK